MRIGSPMSREEKFRCEEFVEKVGLEPEVKSEGVMDDEMRVASR